MREYILRDVITNPLDPRLKGAIGKKVFCGKEVSNLLKNANSDECGETLTQIEDVDFEPFTTKDEYGDPSDWNCIIIPREEPKPKFIPFENEMEFFDAYRRIERLRLKDENFYISIRGIWLQDKEMYGKWMVIEIYEDGVILGSNQEETLWNKLLNNYVFLDGTPCGKEASE